MESFRITHPTEDDWPWIIERQAATTNFHCVEKKTYADRGCTGRTDYKVWFGYFTKHGE